jgi:hypothetical protein
MGNQSFLVEAKFTQLTAKTVVRFRGTRLQLDGAPVTRDSTMRIATRSKRGRESHVRVVVRWSLLYYLAKRTFGVAKPTFVERA